MRLSRGLTVGVLWASCAGALTGTEALPQGSAPQAPNDVRVVATDQRISVSGLTLATASPSTGRKVELRVDLTSSATRLAYPYSAIDDGYGHPLGITVDAVVTRPDGSSYTLPAFAHVPYRRQSDTSGREAIGGAGPPDWRVRLLPGVPGRYGVRVAATDASGTTSSQLLEFDVAGSPTRGFLRVHGSDPRFLVYDNGDDFAPVAEGRQWSPDPKRPTLAYAEAFAADAAAGVNLTRIWDQSDSYNLSVEGSDPVWQPAWSQFTKALGIELQGAYRGTRAARFTTSDVTTEGYFQLVAVTPNTDYELSAVVRTSQLSGDGAAVTVRAESYLTPGSVSTAPARGTTDWTPVRTSFRTGPDERVLGVWAGARNSTGTAWFDDLRLSPAGADYNILPDEGFERHFPKADRGNDPEDPVLTRSVPKGTFFNPWSAFRLDRILESAEEHGVAVQLCAHGDVYWTWDATIWDSDYARQNGYTVAWTDQRHLGYWKRNLRYRVARWSYSPALLAWEIWNEHGHIPIQGTSQETDLFRFYQQLVPFIAEQDPYDHLITTSQGSQAYSPEFYSAVGMGVVNYHDYITTGLPRHPVEWTGDAAMFVYRNAVDLVQRWPNGTPRLPFVWGEMGTLTVWDNSDPVATQGQGGEISRHNWLWAGLFSPVFTSPVDWQASPKHGTTAAIRSFFAGERYSTSGWQTFSTPDLGGSGVAVSNPMLRVMTLRSADQTRLLAWVQHRGHTWARVARDGVSPAPVTGTFTGPAMPAATYRVEWWDTRTGHAGATSTVTHAGGPLTLTLTAPLTTDIAVKVSK